VDAGIFVFFFNFVYLSLLPLNDLDLWLYAFAFRSLISGSGLVDISYSNLCTL